jgi:cytochrome P450
MEGLINISEVINGTWAILCVFVGLLGYYYYAKIWHPYYLGPLKNLPRPKSGLWHYYNYMRKAFRGDPELNMNMSLEYGSIVHLRDKLVLINDTSVKKFYMTYKFPKAKVYEAFDLNSPVLFSSTKKSFHQRIRKLILPAFSNKTLAAMEPTIYRVGSESLVQYLKSCLDTQPNKEFDIMHLFHANTLDVISELVFGETLNTTWDEKKGLYYIGEMVKSQFMLFLRVLIPFYKYIKLPMETLLKPVIMGNINKRRNSSKIHTDILQSMIDSKDPETGKCLTDLEIVDECVSLLFAGMDTTANTLNWTLYEMIKNPSIYKLIADEIIVKFPNLNEPIGLERAKSELIYLNAAIHEGFRMHPVAAGHMPREVPEGGITINGYYLPAKVVKKYNFAIIYFLIKFYRPK